MKRLAFLLLGLAVLTGTTGCCWYPWYGYGYQGMQGMQGMQGYPGCPGGNCQFGPVPGAAVPQGAFNTFDSVQANYPPTGAPGGYPQPMGYPQAYGGNPRTAMGSHASLPTY